jgi:hypothetical protein
MKATETYRVNPERPLSPAHNCSRRYSQRIQIFGIRIFGRTGLHTLIYILYDSGHLVDMPLVLIILKTLDVH